jgi:hypothetical protein
MLMDAPRRDMETTEIDDPNRLILLKDNVLPRLAQSKSDREDPRRAMLRREMELPK